MREYKKHIIFYTAAWLDHVSMYKKNTLPSIQADLKKLAKDGYTWEFVECGFKLKELPDRFDPAKGINVSSFLILEGLRTVIQKCIDQDAIMFLLPPDTIFGKDTVYNAVKMSENKPDSIAIPHIRLTQPNSENKTPTNKELVSMCFNNPHSSFIDSFDNKDANCTWAGISVRQLNNKTYIITHSLPTVYLAKFTASDLLFWDQCVDFGHWDRGWLHKIYRENRVKVIGDSNICFCAEITNDSSNKSPLQKGLKWNDAHFINAEHNNAFRKFYCTLTKK